MKTLLADPASLHLEKIVARSEAIIMVVNTSSHQAACPQCQQCSTRVHSRYQRCVADLPWGGVTVRLALRTRKFFCPNTACARRIFCERLPEVVVPYGRKTVRFNASLTTIGFALGGRAGQRAGSRLSLQASARTLLRRIGDEALAGAESVRVLGVDDFAFRKGQRYGTILVDLEQHKAIELLPDREAATLQGWLKRHPEVQYLSRDRAVAYAEAASQAAPQAVQIADRFHLMKNLTEAFERVVQKHSSALRETARQVSPRYLTEQMLRAEGLLEEHFPDTRPPRDSKAEEHKRLNRQQRVARYEAVKGMQRAGWPISAIGRKLGMHRETVRNFLRAEAFPERAPAYRRLGPIIEYADYLRKRSCRRLLQRDATLPGNQGARLQRQSSRRKALFTWMAAETASRVAARAGAA
jgi:transposase